MTSSNASPPQSPEEATVASFIADLPTKERQDLEFQLKSFCVRHASHHRPVALVTSGGTSADLEVRSVRCLDNFSTGLRGAVSVEEFLRRGYAVIHLWREGTASPFGRILSEVVGIKANFGVSVSALGKLFAGGAEEEDEDQFVQSVLAESDPWFTDSSTGNGGSTNGLASQPRKNNKSSTQELVLHRRIVHSSRLQTALKERHTALQEGRLLTVPFRTVEQYLAKLQLCSQSLQDSQSLAILFLAAAVSDFYVPKSERAEHKIQSKSTTNGESAGLTLKLSPVPKVMGLIRSTWAPNAFVCSFKLETNSSILRQKAERAVREYGCHMVVGNLLETRYNQVWILAPPPVAATGPSDSIIKPSVQDWPMHSLVKQVANGDPDALECQLIDAVVQAHFEYISTSYDGTLDKSGAEAVLQAQADLELKRRSVQREIFWTQVQTVGWEWAGVAVGAVLSYAVSAALRQRMNG